MSFNSIEGCCEQGLYSHPDFRETCPLMKAKLHPFCMLGCWDSHPPATPQPVPYPSSLEGNQSFPATARCDEEGFTLLGVRKTPFPSLQRLRLNPLMWCAACGPCSAVTCTSGQVGGVAAEVTWELWSSTAHWGTGTTTLGPEEPLSRWDGLQSSQTSGKL